MESGAVLQLQGGRFCLPSFKARRRAGWAQRLGGRFDQDQAQYVPGKTARHEAKEKAETELAQRRARLDEEAARKAAEKAIQPKKPFPKARTEWVVVMVKGKKMVEDTTWYQVPVFLLVGVTSSPWCPGKVGGLEEDDLGAGEEPDWLSGTDRGLP